MSANLENSAVATALKKVSFHFKPKKGNAKQCSNYHTIVFISHASKVMLKIIQVRVQEHVTEELSDVRYGFRKRQRNQRPSYQHLLDHTESKRITKKHLLPLL